jgi:hypothetical protein
MLYLVLENEKLLLLNDVNLFVSDLEGYACKENLKKKNEKNDGCHRERSAL